MISFIRGKIRRLDKEGGEVVVEANNVGYTVLLPVFIMRSLIDRGRKEGDDVAFEVYYHVTEKQPRPVLVGFNNEFERRFFLKLLDVEAMGPTRAARALVFSVSTVAQAIEDRDARLLTQMPGIGARTAQKVIATLSGKVAEFALLKDEGYSSAPPEVQTDTAEEAVEVLAGLGYRRADALQKVQEALKRNPAAATPEELIREVFRKERE